MTWLDDLGRAADDLGPRWREVVRAFGGDDPGPEGELGHLPARIVSALVAEVDPDQAALFARRYGQVADLLGSLPAAEGRLLATLLERRAHGILGAAGPRALRIRALADFVFSQAAVVAHARPDAPTIEQLAGSVAFDDVARGVRHARLEGLTDEFGPVHVNLLALKGVRLQARDCRPRGDLAALSVEEGAVAAFSGGFFLYSEADIAPPSRRTDPVGLLVTDGEVVGPPIFRRGAFVQRTDGSLTVEVVSPDGRWVRIGERRVRVGGDVALVTRARAKVGPDCASVAFVGDRVVAAGTRLPVPLAGAVLTVAGRVGQRVVFELDGVATAVGGGPMLLGPNALDLVAEDFAGSAPPVTFSQDETFDTNLLPRLAVGTTSDGEAIVAAIDGRNFDRAVGLTLRGAARLLAALGCEQAVNLDGGSSKRMVVRGTGVDLPSTDIVAREVATPVRPVHSGVLVWEA